MSTHALHCDPTVLRAVAPPEVPYPGVLTAGDPGRYLVAADDGPGVLWEAGAEHVLGAVDIDRVDDRDVLVLPRLSGRLLAGTRATTPGQAVTLLVSLLRGGQSADLLGVDSGQWWLTDDGRPVLVPIEGASWRRTAREVIEGLGEIAELTALTSRALEILAVPEGYARAAAALEDELFAHAVPEPLDAGGGIERNRAEGLRDQTWREIVHGETREDAVAADRSSVRSAGMLQREVTGAVSRLVDGGIGQQLSQAWSSVVAAWSGRRRRSASRPSTPESGRPPMRAGSQADSAASPGREGRGSRRPLVFVVGAVAAATLAIGFLLPADAEPSAGPAATRGQEGTGTGTGRDAAGAGAVEDGPGSAEQDAGPADGAAGPAAGSAPGDGATDEAAPDEEAPVPSGSDGAAAADPNLVALDALARCLSDGDGGSCRADVLERPDAVIPPGIASDPDAERTVTVLDDLGDVVVTRVEGLAEAAPAQIAVLIDRDDKRLVRDVYDNADQP